MSKFYNMGINGYKQMVIHNRRKREGLLDDVGASGHAEDS